MWAGISVWKISGLDSKRSELFWLVNIYMWDKEMKTNLSVQYKVQIYLSEWGQKEGT